MPTTGVPKKYEHVTLQNFKVVAPHQRKLYDEVENYTEYLIANRTNGLGLAIIGPPGTGKTMASCIIANYAASSGFSVRFTTLAAHVRLHLEIFSLQSAWQKMGDQDAYYEWQKRQDFLKKLRNKYDFVILDDIGKEHTTGSNFAEDEFDYLIRRRAHMGLPVILTSNHPVTDWSTKYSASMASFLRESCKLVAVSGKDYRKENNG